MKFKLLIFIFVIIGLAYFSYPIIMERYFDNGKTTVEIQSPMDNNQPLPNGPDPMMDQDRDSSESSDLEKSLSGETSTEDTKPPIDINERKVPEGETQANITTEHCDYECNSFAIDSKLLEYCQQVCGLAPVKEVSDCDGKSGIEKDYCQKDLAINKKNSSLCGKIQDANIKLTCQNRIIEDLLENQPESEAPDF